MEVLRNFYKVSIDKYKFKDDIIDIYSNEEKIRQWFINELMETYKYPERLIDVEYKVNNFSKIGSVDICISIYKNGNKIPYIFVETKAFGTGLNDGIRQLKSYMSCCRTCEYGIAVDGNEIYIINKNSEVINDISLFNSSMLPSSIESYKYINLRTNKESIITMDINDKCEIMIEDSHERKNYKEIELANVLVYTNIAAVAIDDSSTLNRFMKMGDTILLIPENKKYEPIQLRDDQARILGVAVGIIKRSFS